MPPKKTLRDEFAIAALKGDWSSQNPDTTGEFENDTPTEALERRARLYYRMADAMCKVRHEAARKGFWRGRVFPFRRKDDPKLPEQP